MAGGHGTFKPADAVAEMASHAEAGLTSFDAADSRRASGDCYLP